LAINGGIVFGLRSGLKIMSDFVDERVAEVASDYDGQAVSLGN